MKESMDLEESIQTLREMKEATHEIGTTVVLQRILGINQQMKKFQDREIEFLKCDNIKKRRKMENLFRDENMATTVDVIPVQGNSLEDRRSLMHQAMKMKRLSLLFRNMETIQSMIMHELGEEM
jgi:hypothetical protein